MVSVGGFEGSEEGRGLVRRGMVEEESASASLSSSSSFSS